MLSGGVGVEMVGGAEVEGQGRGVGGVHVGYDTGESFVWWWRHTVFVA